LLIFGIRHKGKKMRALFRIGYLLAFIFAFLGTAAMAGQKAHMRIVREYKEADAVQEAASSAGAESAVHGLQFSPDGLSIAAVIPKYAA
jgi:hypothetical protein